MIKVSPSQAKIALISLAILSLLISTSSSFLTYAQTPTAVDTTPPNTEITSAVDSDGKPVQNGGTTTSNSIRFMFRGIDSTGAVSNFQCSIDNRPYSTCSSGANYPALAAGSHSFAVVSLDSSGNLDQSPAIFTWNFVNTNKNENEQLGTSSSSQVKSKEQDDEVEIAIKPQGDKEKKCVYGTQLTRRDELYSFQASSLIGSRSNWLEGGRTAAITLPDQIPHVEGVVLDKQNRISCFHIATLGVTVKLPAWTNVGSLCPAIQNEWTSFRDLALESYENEHVDALKKYLNQWANDVIKKKMTQDEAASRWVELLRQFYAEQREIDKNGLHTYDTSAWPDIDASCSTPDPTCDPNTQCCSTTTQMVGMQSLAIADCPPDPDPSCGPYPLTMIAWGACSGYPVDPAGVWCIYQSGEVYDWIACIESAEAMGYNAFGDNPFTGESGPSGYYYSTFSFNSAYVDSLLSIYDPCFAYDLNYPNDPEGYPCW